jgi:hypothetical protein
MSSLALSCAVPTTLSGTSNAQQLRFRNVFFRLDKHLNILIFDSNFYSAKVGTSNHIVRTELVSSASGAIRPFTAISRLSIILILVNLLVLGLILLS